MRRDILEDVSIPPWNARDLEQINATFAGCPTEALLDWATTEFGDRIALTCSFSGASGMVLLDMLARLGRGTPVIFLDTELLFPETYALAEAAARRYGIAIGRRRPAL
jgi:phosphoadenosine phosphosulfate reductase